MLILSASAVFAGGSSEKDGKVVYPKGNFDFVAPGGAAADGTSQSEQQLKFLRTQSL